MIIVTHEEIEMETNLVIVFVIFAIINLKGGGGEREKRESQLLAMLQFTVVVEPRAG